jgi:DNA repair photolyase
MMAKRFGRRTERTWKNMKVNSRALGKNRRKLRGRVMFPSSHDILDIPPIKEACFRVLTELLESGNEVLVTTKPRFSIVQDMDHLFSGHKRLLQFRFTITSMEDRLLSFWEPNAPLFKERMSSLRFAFAKGYRTSVSIEPFLDYDPSLLVKTVALYSTESIWVGKMNYIQRRNVTKEEFPFYEEIRRNYELDHLREIHERLEDFPKVRFKDSIRIKLGLR